MNIVLAVLICLMGHSAFSSIQASDSLAVSKGVQSWIDSYEAKLVQLPVVRRSKYMECKETREIARAFLCVSFDRASMNSLFLRASIFIEGLAGDPGALLPHSSPDVLKLSKEVGGHNLKVTDLIRFYRAVDAACSGLRKDLCLSKDEKELFEEFVLPLAKEPSEAVVITFSLNNNGRLGIKEIVTHEIMHAQYFLQKNYRETVNYYWNNIMSERQGGRIQYELYWHYDVTNREVLINEFQAYMLMADAKWNLLSHFVEDHREALMEMLADAGAHPIQVQF